MVGKILYALGLGAWHGLYLRKRYLADTVLDRLAEQVVNSETQHAGELMIAIESNSHRLEPPVRALEVFGRLRIWDTPHNTGVLIYLALDTHRIEIIADRGIQVNSSEWQAICDDLSDELAQNRYEDGLSQAIHRVEALLQLHCGDLPKQASNVLPNHPVML